MVLFYLQVCNKVKDLVILLGDRVYSDHHIFCDLVGDNLSSPRSGELADIAWGNVGLPSRFTKMWGPLRRDSKSVFQWPIRGFVTCPTVWWS